jgi:putative membrane-bound dehydrogenase-like protein
MMRTLLCLVLTTTSLNAQESPSTERRQQPLSPREALGSFRLNPEFTIELVAAEPDVVDPVCFCFDAKGDLYVVEMRGYPNGGRGEGKPNFPGRIRRLQDKDGDGYFETASIVVEGLRFPCGITPWRHGFLVGDAPDLLFISADGKEKRVLYTGFGASNIQQMINGLQLHHDGWVYGCNGGNESPVKSMEKPDAPVVQLRGMHFRFKPDVPASIEPCSGGGQYGLTVTAGGQWLTCTNSQHLRQIVLPQHYLKRNPQLAVSTTTVDIPDHGAAARVFRVSPFEAWRLERTTRRASSSDAKRFPSTELIPGGYITSACGLAVYDGGTFPDRYHGNVFVCDPANNLVHRDVLKPDGSILKAERHDKDCEFLASTDTWFRPVFLHVGPDGALYLADFYREIIETPLSLPDDIKAKWNLNSRERGRIWRIKPRRPVESISNEPMQGMKIDELLRKVSSTNCWQRQTAFRLLLEQRQNITAASIQRFQQFLWIPEGKIFPWKPMVRQLEALALLQELSEFTQELLEMCLESGTSTVQEKVVQMNAIQWCEKMKSLDTTILDRLHKIADQGNPQVRFQLALSLGSLPISVDDRLNLAGRLLNDSKVDHWYETAILSSLHGNEYAFLKSLLIHPRSPSFLERLAQLASKRMTTDELLAKPELTQALAGAWDCNQLALLRGLGRDYVQRVSDIAQRLKAVIHQQATSESDRVQAIGILSFLPWKETQSIFTELLNPISPPASQQAALQAIKSYQEDDIAKLLLKNWPSYSPTIRRETQEVLFSRARFITYLLDRAEAGEFAWQQLDGLRREQLGAYKDAPIRKRALALQAKLGTSTRKQVLDRYQPSVELKGDVVHGKALFAKHCASCHRLENVGHQVGADLLGALTNKTPELLLQDILDPNREVDPRFVNYVIVTKAGRTITGIISNEGAASITLKRAEGLEETILRTDIDEMTSSSKSLMPENLEEQMKQQEVADVIRYLLSVREGKK